MRKGNVLGKLEVISYAGKRYDTTRSGEKVRHLYMAKCDCGNVKKIRRCSLKNEKVRSCGCVKRGRKK